MASAPILDLKPIINTVLDRARAELGVDSDEALGGRLDVSDQAIYLWRQGKVAKSARVLIPLIIREFDTLPTRPRVKFRRRRKSVEV